MRAPAAVVFDFDGVILDTEWTTYETVNEVFLAHGQELSIELWVDFIGRTDHPHWADILDQQLGENIDRDRWVPLRVERGLQRARQLDLLPGVLDLLDDLATHNVSIAVSSSSQGHWVRGHLEHRGLDSRFVAICTGDEVLHTKPDPALYLLACSRLGVDPRSAVAIEDSLHGAAAAQAAGMHVVVVPGHMTAHLDHSAVDLVVHSCEQLNVEVLAHLVES